MAFAQSYNRGNLYHKGDILLYGSPFYVASTYLMNLTSSSGVVATAKGAVPGVTRVKLKIQVDGVDLYLLAANDWVDANSASNSPSVSPSASSSPSASGSASVSPSHV